MSRLFVEGIKELKIKKLVKNLREESAIRLTYTTPVQGLETLKSTINHNIDEGKTK